MFRKAQMFDGKLLHEILQWKKYSLAEFDLINIKRLLRNQIALGRSLIQLSFH